MAIVTIRAVTVCLSEHDVHLLRDAVADYRRTVDLDDEAELHADLLNLSEHLQDLTDGFAALSRTEH